MTNDNDTIRAVLVIEGPPKQVEVELDELQRAGFLRVDSLEKNIKANLKDQMQENATVSQRHLALWHGHDDRPGLSELLQKQMNLFRPQVEDEEPRPAAQMDWTQEDIDAQNRAWAEDDAEHAAAPPAREPLALAAASEPHPDDVVEADYEIVEDEGPGFEKASDEEWADVSHDDLLEELRDELVDRALVDVPLGVVKGWTEEEVSVVFRWLEALDQGEGSLTELPHPFAGLDLIRTDRKTKVRHFAAAEPAGASAD